MLFDLFGGGRETRSTSPLENPSVGLSDPAVFREFLGGGASFSGEEVTEAAALGVPAIWAAVNIIAGTIAHLPLHLFADRGEGAEKATTDPLYRVVHDQANSVHTSYAWRKWAVTRLLLDGRALTQIIRNGAGKVMALVPIPAGKVDMIDQRVERSGLVRVYKIDGRAVPASDILDFVWMPKSCSVDHYRPLAVHRNAIGLVIAAERYAATIFQNGGVPPLVLEGPPMSPAAAERAGEDINNSLRSGRDRKRNILPIPGGFKLHELGFDPSRQQLLELRRFQISEVSRIFNIAPALLFDLTTGTYSNVEQQNLSFSSQTILPIVEMIEMEMNSKLFGQRNTRNFVEFNLDGLARGDFLSRMNGLARAVQTGLRTPNEARAYDNLPPMPFGDDLLIQGATVPLRNAGQQPTNSTPDINPALEADEANDDQD